MWRQFPFFPMRSSFFFFLMWYTSNYFYFFFFLESAMDLHLFPILKPPHTSLPIPSRWVILVHQPWALDSCINACWSTWTINFCEYRRNQQVSTSIIFNFLITHTHLKITYSNMPGAIMGDPTHDKLMRRRPETQGCSGYKGPSRLTPASTPPCMLPLFLLSCSSCCGSLCCCWKLSCSSFTI